MRVILKSGLLILAAETPEDEVALAQWRETARGHVFHFDGGSVRGGALRDIGLREAACREAINILFDQGDPAWRPISNLAHTPFTLDERTYASVEGFWQGLKLADGADRARLAALWGREAKASARGPEPDLFVYEGQTFATGGPGHRNLMARACQAKFAQHALARETLLATGERLLLHRVRRDSVNIPGALMADIWMRIRARLRRGGELGLQAAESDGRILYFGRDRQRFGFLSHFEPSPIEIEGEVWPTVEHYYQAQKSLDPAYAAAIRAAPTPGAAKQLSASPDSDRLGARTSWFRLNARSPRADWAAVKLDVMRRADMAKFTQNPGLGERLLATGETELVEDSPFDVFWGLGPDGQGLNWAGQILMEVRQALSSAARAKPP